METMTTTQARTLLLTALTGQNYSPKTIRAYGDDIQQFMEWVAKNRVDWDNPVKLTRVDIEGFMNYLAGHNMTGVTRVRKLAAIRKFFTFMNENSILTANPANTIKGARREHKDPSVLFKNEYKALLFEASGNIRDYAIIMTFLQTGIREGELVNIKMVDLDLENKNLTIKAGKGKKDRNIPLEDQTIAAIKRYLKFRATELLIIDDEYVFLAKNGTTMNVRTVRHMVTKYMKQAGVKKQASVHTLRHTYGTHKINNGMNIKTLQELMGHNKMETTYKYVHLAQTNLRREQVDTAL